MAIQQTQHDIVFFMSAFCLMHKLLKKNISVAW